MNNKKSHPHLIVSRNWDVVDTRQSFKTPFGAVLTSEDLLLIFDCIKQACVQCAASQSCGSCNYGLALEILQNRMR